MKNKKAYIYSRISPLADHEILTYQEKILNQLALDLDYDIAYQSYSISYSLLETESLLNEIISIIQGELVDALIIWSPIRITVSKDLYEEIEMLCEMHHIQIISYKNN